MARRDDDTITPEDLVFDPDDTGQDEPTGPPELEPSPESGYVTKDDLVKLLQEQGAAQDRRWAEFLAALRQGGQPSAPPAAPPAPEDPNTVQLRETIRPAIEPLLAARDKRIDDLTQQVAAGQVEVWNTKDHGHFYSEHPELRRPEAGAPITYNDLERGLEADWAAGRRVGRTEVYERLLREKGLLVRKDEASVVQRHRRGQAAAAQVESGSVVPMRSRTGAPAEPARVTKETVEDFKKQYGDAAI